MQLIETWLIHVNCSKRLERISVRRCNCCASFIWVSVGGTMFSVVLVDLCACWLCRLLFCFRLSVCCSVFSLMLRHAVCARFISSFLSLVLSNWRPHEHINTLTFPLLFPRRHLFTPRLFTQNPLLGSQKVTSRPPVSPPGNFWSGGKKTCHFGDEERRAAH